MSYDAETTLSVIDRCIETINASVEKIEELTKLVNATVAQREQQAHEVAVHD